MNVELRSNGLHQLILVPESRVQRVLLEEMFQVADKGRPVKISAIYDDAKELVSMTVSVEA